MTMMARARLAESPKTQDYFGLLSARAEFAAQHGNYAISAALVIHEHGRETVFEGWNTLFAEQDPSGHAEMNAIRLAHAVASLPEKAATALVERARAVDALHVREQGDDGGTRRVLYTTLEPCPMCTVCLINAGIDHVVVAAQDPPSGSLELTRLRRLPPLWLELAEAGGLQVSFCQSTDTSDPLTFLPETLHDELLERFAESRAALDRTLGEGGVLNAETAAFHAWTLLHGD
jgi:tRNA(Arg) A34 adenosine deaminase TadA